jgi:hypothetical protein
MGVGLLNDFTSIPKVAAAEEDRTKGRRADNDLNLGIKQSLDDDDGGLKYLV